MAPPAAAHTRGAEDGAEAKLTHPVLGLRHLKPSLYPSVPPALQTRTPCARVLWAAHPSRRSAPKAPERRSAPRHLKPHLRPSSPLSLRYAGGVEGIDGDHVGLAGGEGGQFAGGFAEHVDAGVELVGRDAVAHHVYLEDFHAL